MVSMNLQAEIKPIATLPVAPDASLREKYEAREGKFLSSFGCLSVRSQGRRRAEAPCEIRTAFQVDRDRIVYSNAFRRLKYKTQVFLAPLGDYYRTRLSHTLEVAQIARTIARAMFLNEDLAEAIALGHDLGHPPFGHSGERALQEIFDANFQHNRQSVRVVEVLENKGQGLNLTFEVRNGILKHSKGYGKIIPDSSAELAATFEGRLVRIADIMAYLNHDLDDAIRSGVIEARQVPRECTDVLGASHSQRATTMIRDVIHASRVCNGALELATSEPVAHAMATLRQFLYDHVYRSPQVHNEFIKAKKILIELYTFYLDHPDELIEERRVLEKSGCSLNHNCQDTREQLVCDLIASMTDRYALNLYKKKFFPSSLF